MVVDQVVDQRVDHGADQAATADRLLHALADSTRRDIVGRTIGQEHSISSLARLYPMSFAAVQKHVAILDRAGLVTKRRQGREQLVRGNVDTLRAAGAVLDRMEALWRGRLNRIDALLTSDNEGTGT